MQFDLEDDFNDILQKAADGLSMGLADLALKADVPESVLKKLFAGTLDEAALRRVAPLLGLRTEALCAIAKGTWYPRPQDISGLWQIPSLYGSMEVNAYLVKIPGTQEAVLFDTGTDASHIFRKMDEASLYLKAIFLTHTHTDHIAELDTLRKCPEHPTIYASVKEPVPEALLLSHDDEIDFGTLTVEARSTSGHSPGGLTYVLKGLRSEWIAFVGDALFAGSMGRGFVSYKEALRSNKEEILSLPASTILCPGHGPMSTVGEERAHNPLFSFE